MASADYAVVGDVLEIVPAITAELRRVRGVVIASALALAAAIAVAGAAVRPPRAAARPARPDGPRRRASTRADDVPDRAARRGGRRRSASASCCSGSCPGLMHAFIFWAFIVLFPAIFIAMIEIVDPDSAPDWALVRRAVRRVLRARADRRGDRVLHPQGRAAAAVRGQPPRRGRPDPAWIAGIVGTLLALHATDSRVFAWAHVLLILGFLAYLPHSKHLHIATAAINVYFGRTRARGRLEPLRFDEDDARGGDALRHRDRRGPDVEADDGRVLVHRVRALPGRLPGVRDRQDAVAQARDHGRARPPVRGGAEGARRRLRRPAGRRDRAARGDGLGLRDVRRLRRGVPGQHRAHRPHRRPAPAPRDGRVALPERGRADAARRRAPGQPLGQAAGRARRLGRGARRPRARARRPGRRRSCTGSAAPRRSTSARARARGRRRSC